MKHLLMLFLLAICYTQVWSQKNETLEIGEQMPAGDAILVAPDGEEQQLVDFTGENGLLVIFTCNTCPFVLAWENRYNELQALCKDNGIGMILINSNAARHEGVDSPSAMAEHAKKMDYKAPYVLDKGAEVADAFGARTTPHVYLFNAEGELVYRGAIDDSQEKSKVSKHYLSDAIHAIAAHQRVEVATTKPVGCSIKRVQ